MIARLAPTAAEAREVTASAIDNAIRQLQVAIRCLELLKEDIDRPSLSAAPFVKVFPPRGKA